MNKQLLVIAICLASLSCEDRMESCTSSEEITGFWARETVYFNGVKSIEYVDFLNGTNFLKLSKDGTFERAYDLGFWHLVSNTLVIERGANSGIDIWIYKIIEQSGDVLILEMKSSERKYCCNFDSFKDNEVITIKEVYKRTN